jgi:hypothetical protein
MTENFAAEREARLQLSPTHSRGETARMIHLTKPPAYNSNFESLLHSFQKHEPLGELSPIFDDQL